MRKLWAALAAVALVMVGFASPAHADYSIGSHWSYFKWAGSYQPVRAFYLFDRSGDSTVHAAMQQVLSDLAYDLNARNAWGIVPAPTYIQDDADFGQCDSTPFSAGNGFQSFVGYSFITLCAGGQGGGTSITWSAGVHNAENYHPSIHVQREYSDYNSTYTHLYHELFHALGVSGHSVAPSLMRPTLPPYTILKPTGADYDLLTNFYGGYGVFNHPWNS